MLAQQHSDDKTLAVSVGQFHDIIKSEGVTKIETIGKEFDPFLMEAVTTEAGKENTVIKELRVGYMLHDKVLRPAQVTVGNGEKS
jgi:molecular chaperone GrpE